MKFQAPQTNRFDNTGKSQVMTRRSFLVSSAAAAAVWCLPDIVSASVAKRPLSFYNTHTGEKMVVHYSHGGYNGSVRKALEYFLRDFRTGERHPLDPHLFDSLCAIQSCCGKQTSFEVISGYRSPETNAYLRKISSGVARKSLHMDGRAIDIRVTDLPTNMLRDIAINLHNGGVGYYPKSNFVHIDTGRKRRW